MTACARLDHVSPSSPSQSRAARSAWRRETPGCICASAWNAGKVGCCDDSPNRHGSAHALTSGHPLIRSLEPGEDWSGCFVDDLAMLIHDVRGETRIHRSPLA